MSEQPGNSNPFEKITPPTPIEKAKEHGSGELSLENKEITEEESRLYEELQEVMNEEDRIMTEINKVFESTSDRSEAEKIILEKWAPSMDEAFKKSSELINQWLEAMRKSQQGYERGLEE
jgi:hypothetical protein